VKRNNEHRIWLAVGLIVALAIAGLMTAHTVRHFERVHRAAEAIRPWMSVPYIARSHHVHARPLFDAIGVEPDRFDRRPIGRIARQQHRPVEELMRELNEAIARERGRNPASP